jgi:hypothetical protein
VGTKDADTCLTVVAKLAAALEIPAMRREAIESAVGTFETCPPTLTMSVHRDNPEVAVVRPNRRECPKAHLRRRHLGARDQMYFRQCDLACSRAAALRHLSGL